MVTVGLLSFIVLGLVAMFSQTQRAFKTSLTQVDVMESGRSLAEILVQELAQMTPSSMSTTNFMVETDAVGYQGLPGTTTVRTNVLQKFFFLSQINQDWTGIGYHVIPDRQGSPVGTLYRYQSLRPARRYFVPRLASDYLQTLYAGLVTNRVVDGVVHLKVTPYALNGFPFVGNVSNVFYRTDHLIPNEYARLTNAIGFSVQPGLDDFYFLSNSVPAYVELEFGLLERQALQRYRSLPTNNPSILTNFLADNVAHLHLFRQRIPIRNVDLSAYQ